MDFIDMLLVIEDDDENDSDDEDHQPSEQFATPLATPTSLNSDASQATLHGASAPVAPAISRPTSSLDRSPEPVPEWCKCGKCRAMPQDLENKCCKQRNCVSLSRRFVKLCLDAEYLQLSLRNSGDIRSDRDDNSSRAFRKAAYRHYILDKYSYLGKNKRKVCPSCCVWAIRQHYPSPTGVYMGFRSR